MKNENISVYITVKFRVDNACNENDLIEDRITLGECINSLIEDESLFGVVSNDDDYYEILRIEKCEDVPK